MSVIFVHIPKTAGTALANAIGARIGENISYEGYNKTERTPTWHQRILFRLIQSIFTRTNSATTLAQCQNIWRMFYAPSHNKYIFGHFYVQKYLQPAPQRRWVKYPHYQYVSFIRDPLQRAISKYYYTHQVALRTDADYNSLQFAKSFPSLNTFLVSNHYSNIQSRHISALPLSDYACIGVVEELEKSLFVLGAIFPKFASLKLQFTNHTTNKNENEITAIPSSVRDLFQAQNHLDYALYSTAITYLNQTYESLSNSEKVVT
jgi:hypothetical protein